MQNKIVGIKQDKTYFYQDIRENIPVDTEIYTIVTFDEDIIRMLEYMPDRVQEILSFYL